MNWRAILNSLLFRFALNSLVFEFRSLLLVIFMSKRAEGCGQWLSAKSQTTKTQLAGGKAKKKKGLLNFASRGHSGGLNIHVSCSPLSPGTRKKLKNAKQSKIDKFFKGDPRPNVPVNDNIAASKRAGLLEEKRTKVPVKRQREHCSSGKLKT